MITQEYVKEILQYNENTGIFTWLKKPNCKVKIGNIAGTLHKYSKYVFIRINNKQYKAHRLAWLYIKGVWPKNQIDHINGIRDDNRIDNLREVSHRQNGQNRREHRNGKLVGASFHKTANKWQAHISIKGRLKNLGLYNTEQEAHEAYLKFLKQLDDK